MARRWSSAPIAMPRNAMSSTFSRRGGRSASWLLALLAAAIAPAGPPAGTRPAQRSESGASILPGGRRITPLGEQFFTGPGPFGLAVSPSGGLVVTADGGPNRYALT